MPQYSSTTVSRPVRAAKSNALPYSTSVCARFTWKKEGTDSRNTWPHSVSSSQSRPQRVRNSRPKITLVFRVFTDSTTPASPGSASRRASTSSPSRGRVLPLATTQHSDSPRELVRRNRCRISPFPVPSR